MISRRPERLLPVFALLLGASGAFADPPPEGTAMPGAPEGQTAPDNAQPAVTEQQGGPPAAPKEESTQPEAEKPGTDASAAPKADEPPQNVEPVAPTEAFAVLGKKVRGPDGKDVLGSIIDILVDDQGRPRAAIVDFGGFLGVGSRKIAVDWQLMKFRPADPAAQIVLDLDRSQIQAAPEYKDPTQPAKVVEPTVANAPATPPADNQAPANAPPPPAPSPPPGSVAAPAPPPVDSPAQDADKHAN